MIELVVPDAVLPPPSTMDEHLARHRRVIATIAVDAEYQAERGLSPLEVTIRRALRDKLERVFLHGDSEGT